MSRIKFLILVLKQVRQELGLNVWIDISGLEHFFAHDHDGAVEQLVRQSIWLGFKKSKEVY